MLFFASEEVKEKLTSILEKYNLPIGVSINSVDLLELIRHDKKTDGNDINIVFVDKIGTFRIEKINVQDLISFI